MTKRSCKRTTDENLIHKKAVEMRKKTDEQLVHYVEDRVEKHEAKDSIVEKHMHLKTRKAQRNLLHSFS